MNALPAGWTRHPDNPEYAYNAATGSVVLANTLPAATPAVRSYGEQDMEQALRDYEASAQGSGNLGERGFFWLDFPDYPSASVNEVSVTLRVLPPWSMNERVCYLPTLRHRVPTRLVPGSDGKKEASYIECWNDPAGPGNCPICHVLGTMTDRPELQTFIREVRARASTLWQAINVNEPSKHLQLGRDAHGREVVTAVYPGVLRAGIQLNAAMMALFKHAGKDRSGALINFVSPESGCPIELVKSRDPHSNKPAQLNVEYAAHALSQLNGPIEPHYQPVLDRLVDLRAKCVQFADSPTMEGVAVNMQHHARTLAASAPQAAGRGGYAQPPMPSPYAQPAPYAPPPMPAPAPAVVWMPHPDSPTHEYNAAGQIRLRAATPSLPPAPPALPPAPPAAPPAPPAAPPAMALPPAPPAAPPAPPAPPVAGALPPATAPGLPPGAVAPAPPAFPPPGALPGLPGVPF